MMDMMKVLNGYKKNSAGSAAIIMAALLPAVIVVIGLLIDFTLVFIIQYRLDEAVYSACTAAAEGCRQNEKIKDIADELCSANIAGARIVSINRQVETFKNIKLEYVEVSGEYCVTTAFLKAFNIKGIILSSRCRLPLNR